MAKVSTSSRAMRKKTTASRVAKTVPAKVTLGQAPGERVWSLALAILYFLEGIAILVASTNYRVPVTISYLGQDTLASQASGHLVVVNASRHVADFNLAWLVAAYLLVSAVMYGFIAYWLSQRTGHDNRRQNGLRIAAYAVSSGVMVAVIGLISGMYDLASLIMVFAVQVIAGLLWLAAFRHDIDATGPLRGWVLYWLGVAAAIVPWVVLAIYASGNLVYGNGVPTYVNAIYDSIFALFVGIAANFYLQRKKIRVWVNAWYGDRLFMVLNFVALSTLAWLVFVGVLHP